MAAYLGKIIFALTFLIAPAANAQMMSECVSAAPPFAKFCFNFKKDDKSDFRPVLNADASRVIFERTPVGSTDTRLHIGDFSTGKVWPFVKVSLSERPDWCWNRSGGGRPTIGRVAFSQQGDDGGIWLVDADGSNLQKLPGTVGMAYPSWYPDCNYLAVDIQKGVAVPGRWFSAKINTSGDVLAYPLGGASIWTGFPSVNQVNPKLISFAAQVNGFSSGFANYYNQDQNYTFVSDTTNLSRPRVAPMERQIRTDLAFMSKYQARAGWWSPDGKWFAFESNRVCDNISGQIYAIFIQDSAGRFPAKQVSDCAKWNVQHPKWYPAGTNGVSTKLIAAVAEAKLEGTGPFHIATFDVSDFVTYNR